jgi:hypothetical protein
MKAQAASIDLMLSATVLSLLLFGLITFLLTETNTVDSQLTDNTRDRLVLSAAGQLALSNGIPDDWNAFTCTRLGLSCGQGTLCPQKASSLASLYFSDYNRTKDLINLRAYGVSILVCNASNYSQCIYNLTTAALESDRASSSHVSRAEALSSLNGTIVSVIVYAWE